jgi:hypothetical protein
MFALSQTAMSFSPLLMGWWDKWYKKPRIKVDYEKIWRDKVNKIRYDKKTKK